VTQLHPSIPLSVITLTTAGLGDLVPTSDGSKILCSVFIYFGVACIGLLLGSYIAGMLDETSSRQAKANRIDSCPNCARIKTLKQAGERGQINFPSTERKSAELSSGRSTAGFGANQVYHPYSERGNGEILLSERQPNKKLKHDNSVMMRTNFSHSERSATLTGQFETKDKPPHHEVHSPIIGVLNDSQGGGLPTKPNLLGSPMTAQILGRQSHTRHESFDLNSSQVPADLYRTRNFSAELPALEQSMDTLKDSQATPPPPPPQRPPAPETADNEEDTEEETSDSDETASWTSDEDDNEEGGPVSRVKNAKYVFLVLKEALVNSMVIIAFGCLGFYFIEGFSIVDSKFILAVSSCSGFTSRFLKLTPTFYLSHRLVFYYGAVDNW
jgi:hypothetical protein